MICVATKKSVQTLLGAVLVWAALTVAAVPVQAQASSPNVDPFERLNRGVFQFNETIDGILLRPLAQGYEFITPRFVRTGVSNFFSNLFYPRVIINQLLQGKPLIAVQDTTRFVVNSTFGIGGLFDIATPTGLERNHEDFGQTLGVWGVGAGPYLVLPIFGPSSVRDSIGLVADYYSDPLFYYKDESTIWQLSGLAIISKRAELFGAERLISGDKYLFVRDSHLQRRKYLVQDGALTEEDDPFLADD